MKAVGDMLSKNAHRFSESMSLETELLCDLEWTSIEPRGASAYGSPAAPFDGFLLFVLSDSERLRLTVRLRGNRPASTNR